MIVNNKPMEKEKMDVFQLINRAADLMNGMRIEFVKVQAEINSLEDLKESSENTCQIDLQISMAQEKLKFLHKMYREQLATMTLDELPVTA